MKAFLYDVNRCSGCYCCQMACKDEHCGNDWAPYAKPQPETGHFWGRLDYIERGQVPHVKVAHIWIPCQHCQNAPCVTACPIDAIRTRNDGLVIIDTKTCTGCQLCVIACPYDCIFYNAQLQLAQKCTGCAHLLDRGFPIKEPRCSDICFHDAIMFGEESSLDLKGTEKLHPEYGLTTRAYYKNLPKRFIAGTVFTPSDNEVVIGATCTLSGSAGNATVTTDDFGDFWFEGLGEGEFILTISSGGKTKTITGDTTEKDLGLGYIELS